MRYNSSEHFALFSILSDDNEDTGKECLENREIEGYLNQQSNVYVTKWQL